MSKFIKVTSLVEIKYPVSIINMATIDSISANADGAGSTVWCSSGTRFEVKESVEQIEAQLLRDEFAMAALAGFCSDKEMSTESTIRLSYEYADEMLKERSK